jgi:hypothetical protein
MAKLDQPAGEAELGRKERDRPGVEALLERIDERVDEPDEGGRQGQPLRKRAG